jgi:hypothetical protein
MLVICERIFDSLSTKEMSSSPWITIGKKYVVLGIELQPGEGQYYVIPSDEDGGAILSDIKQFRIVSNKLPACWRVAVDNNGMLSFGPEEWLLTDFWDRYHDGEAAAAALYKEIKEALLREES